MTEYTAVNILDLIDTFGEDEVCSILSTFSCSRNQDMEQFVRQKSVTFAKQKLSITYLIFDDCMELVGIFTLAHKVLQFDVSKLSSRDIKRIKRYSNLDEDTQCYTTSAFLIAQLGKNDSGSFDVAIEGEQIMAHALATLRSVQRAVGGGVVYLECEDIPKLLSFYQRQPHQFSLFGTRISQRTNITYHQLLRPL